ncbi:hypothetical protein AB1Y20_000496 [Prymnesium parvum]|uniref:Myb-like domain-containing protein n=1 Tax=Prymnesium parvum TaxID=97485 RepID=A0AB34K841_PRYPA
MGDIKDILGISRESGAAAAPKPARPTIKKPEGMSREVFQLLVGDSTIHAGPQGLPAMPLHSPKEAFKEKRARVIGWEWRGFTNSARDDSLQLYHWAKNNDKSSDYTFSRFNKKLKALSYTDEEYERHLKHPAWDKSESALLFELCRRFDLRWPVVHDRFPEGRTLEQLKERYYDMCRALLLARSAAPDATQDFSEHPLAKFRFDAKHERERKVEFERLYARTEQEVRNEVLRLEQAKALEAKMKAQKKLQKAGSRAAGLAALRSSLSENGLGGGTELAVSGLPSLAGLMDAPRKHRVAEVWLRSKDISSKRPVSEKQHALFEERMAQLKMPARPLATEPVVQLYNQCRAHVVLLVELESKLKKLEYEKNLLLMRKHGGGGSGGAPQQGHSYGSSGKRARAEGATASQKRSHH